MNLVAIVAGRGFLEDVGDSAGQLEHVLYGKPLASEPLVNRTSYQRTILGRRQSRREVQQPGVDVGQVRHPVNRGSLGLLQRRQVSVVTECDLSGPRPGPLFRP